MIRWFTRKRKIEAKQLAVAVEASVRDFLTAWNTVNAVDVTVLSQFSEGVAALVRSATDFEVTMNEPPVECGLEYMFDSFPHTGVGEKRKQLAERLNHVYVPFKEAARLLQQVEYNTDVLSNLEKVQKYADVSWTLDGSQLVALSRDMAKVLKPVRKKDKRFDDAYQLLSRVEQGSVPVGNILGTGSSQALSDLINQAHKDGRLVSNSIDEKKVRFVEENETTPALKGDVSELLCAITTAAGYFGQQVSLEEYVRSARERSEGARYVFCRSDFPQFLLSLREERAYKSKCIDDVIDAACGLAHLRENKDNIDPSEYVSKYSALLGQEFEVSIEGVGELSQNLVDALHVRAQHPSERARAYHLMHRMTVPLERLVGKTVHRGELSDAALKAYVLRAPCAEKTIDAEELKKIALDNDCQHDASAVERLVQDVVARANAHPYTLDLAYALPEVVRSVTQRRHFKTGGTVRPLPHRAVGWIRGFIDRYDGTKSAESQSRAFEEYVAAYDPGLFFQTIG